MATIELNFDEAYRKYKAAMRADMARMARRGRELKAETGGTNGPAPLGYSNKHCGYKTWGEIDPAAAPFIREAFRLSYEEDLSIREVLRRMTAAGMRSRHGKEIGPSAMRKILTNPFYAGYVLFDGKLRKGAHIAIVNESMFASRTSAQLPQLVPSLPAL